MSAFEKIAGMFPSRELGEKVAREILAEHTTELVNAATMHIGPEPTPSESLVVSRYVTGWYGALDFIREGKNNTSYGGESAQITSVDPRPTRQEVREAEHVIVQDAPDDVLAHADGILDSAQRYGVRD